MQYEAVFVTLADPDGETLTNFYRQLFEQEPTVQLPGSYAEFQLSGLKLGIFKPKASHATEFASRSSGSMSLCIAVRSLEATIATLTALGYPPSGDISIASYGREIYAYDPQGNRLILYEAEAIVF